MFPSNPEPKRPHMGNPRKDYPLKVNLKNTYYSFETSTHTNKCTNIETSYFLESLSYENYILAGNCVANMIENIPLRDLDFWVTSTNSEDFICVFNEIIDKLG